MGQAATAVIVHLSKLQKKKKKKNNKERKKRKAISRKNATVFVVVVVVLRKSVFCKGDIPIVLCVRYQNTLFCAHEMSRYAATD